jgi:hypothetical protein
LNQAQRLQAPKKQGEQSVGVSSSSTSDRQVRRSRGQGGGLSADVITCGMGQSSIALSAAAAE